MTADQPPSVEDVERAHQTVREHQPSRYASGRIGRPCRACSDPWPCRGYHEAIRVQTDAYGWSGDDPTEC